MQRQFDPFDRKFVIFAYIKSTDDELPSHI